MGKVNVKLGYKNQAKYWAMKVKIYIWGAITLSLKSFLNEILVAQKYAVNKTSEF